jgi:hypothetical protein
LMSMPDPAGKIVAGRVHALMHQFEDGDMTPDAFLAAVQAVLQTGISL